MLGNSAPALHPLLSPSIPPSDGPALPGEVMPVVGYTPTWVLLGIAALVAIVAYTLIVALLTRERLERIPPAPPEPEPDLAELHAASWNEVHEVELAARSGAIDSRTAHERLSGIVRAYVAAATGIPADRMTLADLQRSPLRGTARAVARFYPAVFAADAPNDLDSSLRAAREVLAGWP